MTRIWTGGLTALALVLTASGCGVLEEEAPNREEDPSSLEREEQRTSERLALRTDTLAGGQPYVTDGSGQALYMLEGAGGDPSACPEECRGQWVPFHVSSGAPAAQGGVDEERIGSVPLEGSQAQVTYGGHLLYFYHADRAPGDTKGQDVSDQWGEWYLVGPDGEPVESHGEEEGEEGES